jgi:acetylornithine deacetylase/succinyl-diaminopimelate desuccinylase-like protein
MPYSCPNIWGMTIFEMRITRPGEPVHEVLRPSGTPNVVQTGAELVMRLHALHERIQTIQAPYGLNDSAFVGVLQTGEIFNQSPTLCTVKGTRRWVTPGQAQAVHDELRALASELAHTSGTHIALDLELQGEAFQIEPSHPMVTAFQAAYAAIAGGELPPGNKPFVDDGNTYSGIGGIPALTHGPAATGAHTLNEAVPVAELVRVAQVYALTAIGFCGG